MIDTREAIERAACAAYERTYPGAVWAFCTQRDLWIRKVRQTVLDALGEDQ